MASITRKNFLTGAGALAGAAVMAPYVARAARPTVIKLGTPSYHDPVTRHLKAAADQIKTNTNGEVLLQVFPNSQLGNDSHMLSEVRSGAIQMMGVNDGVLSVLTPSTAIDSVGFAFKDATMAFSALDGAVGDIVRADIQTHGLMPMPKIWDEGFREITTSTKPITAPADLHGLKIRVPEGALWVSLFAALGASPTTMNFAEVYTALQTHVVDGQENPLNVVESNQLFQVQKYCSLTNHMWSGFWMVANGAFWKTLPAAHQKAITEAFDGEAVKQRVANETLNFSLQATLAAKGLKFNTPDPAPFRATLVKAGFYDHWQKKFGAELWSALEKYTGTLA
jgi:tripartite ATP-independent transporter DctP family solute receptor